MGERMSDAIPGRVNPSATPEDWAIEVRPNGPSGDRPVWMLWQWFPDDPDSAAQWVDIGVHVDVNQLRALRDRIDAVLREAGSE